jgi:TorA maturation chaperone TorD
MTAPDAMAGSMTGAERAAGYMILAWGLGYPEEAALRELLADAGGSSGAAGQMAAALRRHVDGDLPGEYNRLFAQGVAVSPYERSYLGLGGDLGVGLGQLAALYQAFGVRAGGGEGEIADHIGAELEFAALLCIQEALHPGEGADIARAARRTFMQERLGRWCGPFAERLAAQARHPYYQTLAGLLRSFVADDLTAQGWRAEAPSGPGVGVRLPVVPVEMEEDALVCPQAERACS